MREWTFTEIVEEYRAYCEEKKIPFRQPIKMLSDTIENGEKWLLRNREGDIAEVSLRNFRNFTFLGSPMKAIHFELGELAYVPPSLDQHDRLDRHFSSLVERCSDIRSEKEKCRSSWSSRSIVEPSDTRHNNTCACLDVDAIVQDIETQLKTANTILDG